MIAWQTRRFIEDNKEATQNFDPGLFEANSEVLKKLQEIPTVYNTYGLDRIRSIARDWRLVTRLAHDENKVRDWYRS
jgi:hypothetical protein